METKTKGKALLTEKQCKKKNHLIYNGIYNFIFFCALELYWWLLIIKTEMLAARILRQIPRFKLNQYVSVKLHLTEPASLCG